MMNSTMWLPAWGITSKFAVAEAEMRTGYRRGIPIPDQRRGFPALVFSFTVIARAQAGIGHAENLSSGCLSGRRSARRVACLFAAGATLRDVPTAGCAGHGAQRRRLELVLMMCPYCHDQETKVVDSRLSDKYAVRRRRECLECGRRFTTYERIEESPIKVIKKDGSRVPFDRERIRKGLEKACYKRPVSDEQIDRIVSQVEADIYDHFEREVPSREIGEKLIELLRDLDQVAFVRFASVYREFKDATDFVEELELLRAQRKG